MKVEKYRIKLLSGRRVVIAVDPARYADCDLTTKKRRIVRDFNKRNDRTDAIDCKFVKICEL